MERSGNRLGWFYHQKNILGSPSIVFIGKEIKQKFQVSEDPKVWLETGYCILTVKEKKILLSDTEWLNNNVMDAAQKLICKALGRLESYQSVLNWQKTETLYFNISKDHTQLMHNGANY